MITFTAAAVAVLYTVADRIIEDVLHIDAYWGQLLEVVVMALVTSVVLWLAVLRPLHRQSTAGEEMAATEEMAYHSTTKALAIALDGLDAELLLADSSEAHLKRVLAVRDEGLAACGVVAPHDCPAIRRSQSLQFESSGALDACPYLDQRPSGPCSAACVPVSVGGRSIGVLHAVGPDGRPATSVQIARWEAVATQVGSHIGMLRVMSTATLQAATDPLTGLLNRRSFENRVHAQLRLGRPFALAMGDLDHFKRLNDAHGHDAGDRALRLFARVLRAALRSEDIISRYGGEEFVIVFPDLTAPQAANALRRMQESMLIALADGSVPGFTVSYGVTDTIEGIQLEELTRIADAALFRAKREGRNRVTVDCREAVELSVAAPASATSTTNN